jgi:hypothetical protein
MPGGTGWASPATAVHIGLCAIFNHVIAGGSQANTGRTDTAGAVRGSETVQAVTTGGAGAAAVEVGLGAVENIVGTTGGHAYAVRTDAADAVRGSDAGQAVIAGGAGAAAVEVGLGAIENTVGAGWIRCFFGRIIATGKNEKRKKNNKKMFLHLDLVWNDVMDKKGHVAIVFRVGL